MFHWFGLRQAVDARSVLDAFGRSQAIIEFACDGTILTANENFLRLLAYTLADIKGRNHRILVGPQEAESAEYAALWRRLRHGGYHVGQYKRIGQGGVEVWIEGSYNAVVDGRGRTYKIVKIATDVTAQKRVFADMQGKLVAIGASQAVIEFGLDGIILDANANFLAVMGYTLDEVKGRHHSMFVDAAYADSAEYREFWANLRRGIFQASKFKRLGKGCRTVWIEAAYSLVLDLNGNPWKVVKYATDITGDIAELASLKATIDRRFDDIGVALNRSNQEAGRAATVVQKSLHTVLGVATGAEQLAATANEIARIMSKSRVATDAANGHVREADSATGRLLEASSAMSGIVELIRSVAKQINLLALNATIESARAGEAGKGFAVVASEVKALAGQAGAATDRIAGEIETLQRVSDDVAASLQRIGRAIDEVREHAGVIAKSVESQSAVTQTMSTDMQRASGTVSAINDNMSAIGRAMTDVASAVDATRDAARVLAK
jgi:methyl-accepting chemotaxis protein